jgi:iron complex outermembrane recepter protein
MGRIRRAGGVVVRNQAPRIDTMSYRAITTERQLAEIRSCGIAIQDPAVEAGAGSRDRGHGVARGAHGMRVCAALAALCGLAIPVVAEDAATDPLPAPATEPALAERAGETIVVTAPKEPLTAATTEAAIAEAATVAGGTDVIPAQEYLRGRSSTMRDMLASSPGVVSQPRQSGEETRMSIRGSGIQRTFHLRGILLLQDGQPVNQADGGGDFQAVDPAILDHVEVYRGANALSYGSNTLGGAINLVTPTGYTAPPMRVRMEGGSFGYIKGLVSAGGVSGGMDGNVAVTANRQDGYRAHSAQENARAFANLGYRFSDHAENRLYLSYLRSDSELAGALTEAQMERDPTQANAGSALRDSKRDYPLTRIADRLALSSGSERLEIGAGYARKELFHPLAFGLVEQDSDDWMGTVRASSEAPWFGHGNRLVVGANGYLGTLEARQYGYAGPVGNARGALQAESLQTARTIEAFIELRHEVASSWWAIVGAQATHADREVEDRFLANGDQSGEKAFRGFSPKLGVLYAPSEHLQAFANVSRSFEPPTFAEYVQRDTSGFTRPQQGLDAQSAWTAEVGTRGSNVVVAWDLSLYHAWVRDEYLSYQVAPGLTQTVNADRTTHSGIEAGLDARLAHGLFAADDRIVLAQSYTYGRFRFDGDPVYGNRRIPGLPEHLWRGELRWQHAVGWYAGPVVEYQSGWPVDYAGTLSAEGAMLVGARAGYQAPQGFSAFIEGKNLLDEQYASTTGIANPATPAAGQALFNPGDGIAVFGGAEWRY